MRKEELFDLNTDKPSEDVRMAAKRRFDGIAKPIDGLGTFEDIICRIAAVQGQELPDISKKALIIMCADNGVAAEGVSQTDKNVTASVATLMGKKKSTVGVMSEALGNDPSHGMVDIIPIDIGIDSEEKIEGIADMKVAKGTGNIAKGPAMTDTECLRAIEAGIDTVKKCKDKGIGLIAVGEMGIGNTTTSTALFCALTGTDPKDVTGRGAGLNDEGLERKTDVIERALAVNGYNNNNCYITDTNVYTIDALDALAKLGGLDIAGIVGVYIGAAVYHIPVIIDGAITAVAALTAYHILPDVKEVMIASHTGKERITGRVLDILGLDPVINADMALGEGTGAVMLIPLLDMVMNLYKNGTRFTDTPIGQYERFDVC